MRPKFLRNPGDASDSNRLQSKLQSRMSYSNLGGIHGKSTYDENMNVKVSMYVDWGTVFEMECYSVEGVTFCRGVTNDLFGSVSLHMRDLLLARGVVWEEGYPVMSQCWPKLQAALTRVAEFAEFHQTWYTFASNRVYVKVATDVGTNIFSIRADAWVCDLCSQGIEPNPGPARRGPLREANQVPDRIDDMTARRQIPAVCASLNIQLPGTLHEIKNKIAVIEGLEHVTTVPRLLRQLKWKKRVLWFHLNTHHLYMPNPEPDELYTVHVVDNSPRDTFGMRVGAVDGRPDLLRALVDQLDREFRAMPGTNASHVSNELIQVQILETMELAGPLPQTPDNPGGQYIMNLTDARFERDIGDFMCTVCQTREPHHVVALACGHVSHRSCMVGWVWQRGRIECPVCRFVEPSVRFRRENHMTAEEIRAEDRQAIEAVNEQLNAPRLEDDSDDEVTVLGWPLYGPPVPDPAFDAYDRLAVGPPQVDVELFRAIVAPPNSPLVAAVPILREVVEASVEMNAGNSRPADPAVVDPRQAVAVVRQAAPSTLLSPEQAVMRTICTPMTVHVLREETWSDWINDNVPVIFESGHTPLYTETLQEKKMLPSALVATIAVLWNSYSPTLESFEVIKAATERYARSLAGMPPGAVEVAVLYVPLLAYRQHESVRYGVDVSFRLNQRDRHKRIRQYRLKRIALVAGAAYVGYTLLGAALSVKRVWDKPVYTPTVIHHEVVKYKYPTFFDKLEKISPIYGTVVGAHNVIWPLAGAPLFEETLRYYFPMPFTMVACVTETLAYGNVCSSIMHLINYCLQRVLVSCGCSASTVIGTAAGVHTVYNAFAVAQYICDGDMMDKFVIPPLITSFDRAHPIKPVDMDRTLWNQARSKVMKWYPRLVGIETNPGPTFSKMEVFPPFTIRPKRKDGATCSIVRHENRARCGMVAAYGICNTWSRPVVYSSQQVNELAALNHRALKDGPRPDDTILDAFCDFYKKSIRKLLPHTFRTKIVSRPFDEYIEKSNASPSVKARLKIAKCRLDAAHISETTPLTSQQIRQWTLRKAFVKVETTNMRNKGISEDKAPRMIQGAKEEFICLVGPYIASVQEHIKRDLNANKNLCFTSGVSTLKAATVLMRDEGKPIENDVSQWDSSVHEKMCKLEVFLVEMLRCAVAIRQLMKANVNTRGFTAGGVYYSCKGTRKSGDPYTSVFNTVLNIMLHMFCCCLEWGLDFTTVMGFVRGVFQGDDALLSIPVNRTTPKFALVMLLLGFKCKCIERNRWIDAEFCSMRLVPCVEGWCFTPKVGKVIAKVGYFANPPQIDPLVLVRGTALGLMAAATLSPALEAYLEQCLELTKSVEAHPTRREEWQMRLVCCTRNSDTWYANREIYGMTRERVDAFRRECGSLGEIYRGPWYNHLVNVDAVYIL